MGFDIVEASTHTSIGRIAAIDDSTLNILFVLEDGRLIPANDDLVTNIDMTNQTITMNIPQGLLEI